MSATPPPLPPVVRAFLDASNAQDTAAWLRTFAPDGAVDDWGRVFTGYEALRGWSDAEFIGAHVTLDVTEVSAGPGEDDVTVLAQVGGDGFNGPSHFAFTVRENLITLMRITA
ncbi:MULTISPECIES: nuclear transport factor 2 family protein [unclassified Streptomyces]|uniref:nuclear transport factor 2 family protein n=1 Tax=unclassified Streptomyces TaxID=2593676 RepID=UPI000CDB63D9|nr:nuclear transport factor 2 family protein [Streptomyces sp. SM10]